MRWTFAFGGLVILAGGALLCRPVPSWADDEPTTLGEVELLIRGPDNRPVANADVVVTPADEYGHSSPEPRKLTAKTDSKGLVSFHLPSGIQRVKVVVVGVGYGATGRVQVIARQTTPAPLAAGAVLRVGRLDPGGSPSARDDDST